MGAQTTVSKIYEATMFLNKTSYVGLTKSVELPTIENTTGDYETLGMQGTIRLANGKEAMECRIDWGGHDKKISLAAYNLSEVQDIMFRSNIEQLDGTTKRNVSFVAYVKGIFRSKNGGNFEAKTDMSHESMIDVFAYKEEIDGVVVVEYDPLNNIYNVGGRDMNADRNRNLGL